MQIKGNIKAVVFDMDGTMVDSIPYHKESWMVFLNKYGLSIRPDEFHAQNHGTIDEMIVRFFGDKLSPQKIKELGDEKEETYRRMYSEDVKELNGLTNFLDGLVKRNIKIALTTNCFLLNIDFILDKLDLRKYFTVITGGHEVKNGKPAPDIYRLTLEKLGLQENEVVVFEDSEGGIVSAKNAGLQVIGVATSLSKPELIEAGCLDAINDFKEIDFAIFQ